MGNRITLLILIISLGAWSGLCSAISISTAPCPSTVIVGQAVPIAINLDSPTQIRGCMVRIAYNTECISYTNAVRGTLFNGQSVGWWRAFNGEPDETPGVLRIECIIFGAGAYITGPGNLLNITFNALTSGYSELNILEIKLYEPVNGTVIPNVTANNGAIIIGTNPAYAYGKCFLQGPYSDGNMETGVNHLLPLNSPYATDPVTVTSIPVDIVDWILVELRTTLDGPALKSQAMWLHSDGSISSPGKPFMLFMNTSSQPYYLRIKHRNHLSLNSNTALSFASSGTPPMLDFRISANVYPDGSVLSLGAYCAMKAGDANQDGLINNLDRNNFWRLQAGCKGYQSADFDLDGKVMPSDLNQAWRANLRVNRLEQTERGGIEFSISEPELEAIGTDTYLNFSIRASGLDSSECLGTGIVLINYDNAAFGECVCAANAVSVNPGALITATFPVYQLITNDYEPGCIAITFEFTGTQAAGTPLPTVYGELIKLRFKIASLDHDSGLAFGSADMQGQQFKADNINIFNPVTTQTIGNIYLPSSPVNLNMQITGTNLTLNWQPVAGCSYTVYGSDNPTGDDWQIEATGLNQATWTQAIGLSKQFYYVSARAIQTENLSGGRF